jgi:hypothetical protein
MVSVLPTEDPKLPKTCCEQTSPRPRELPRLQAGESAWGGAETLILTDRWSASCKDPPHPIERESGTPFAPFLIKCLLTCRLDRAVGSTLAVGMNPMIPLPMPIGVTPPILLFIGTQSWGRRGTGDVWGLVLTRSLSLSTRKQPTTNPMNLYVFECS